MCNFNAICCHCKRFCHGANCCGCCKKHADVDKSDPRLLTDSLIVTRSSEITIDPVSNEIILSLSNSRSSTTVDIDRNSTNMRSRSSKTSVRMGSIIASVKSPSPMESTSPSIGSSKAPSRIGSTLYGLPTETLISSSKEPSRMGSTVPSIGPSKAPSRTGSTLHELPSETLISSSKAPSRRGSNVTSVRSKSPSRTGSTLNPLPTETLISSSKVPSRMGSTVPSIGPSKAPSRIGSTVTSVRSKSPSRTGSTLNALPTETAVVKYTKNSANGSVAPSPSGSTLTKNSTKVPFVEYPIKPTRNSVLSSRMGSTLTTKDPSTNALSRQADELRRSNPRPVNPTVWQEENNLLVKRFLNQAYQIGFPEKKLMNCCNCCCKRLPDQQKGSQNKTDTKIIRSEIKPNERSNRPLSYLRTVKSKQEPRVTEKALEMPKSKSKPKRKAKRKIIVSQPAAKTDEANDLWFECNVPMRVSIPAAICLGAPWDILPSIPKILQTNNNNNKKLKALPAPGSNNKTLAKPGRNLRPPKTPETSDNTTRKFCITVYPMGCGPSVPQPTKEEIIEEPPPVEPRLPKKKKMHSRKKDKSKLKDYTSRKGSKDISISGDMAHTKPRGYTSRKESENSSTSEDIYMSNDREQSLKRRKSMDRDSGDYTSRKGSKNYSLRDDMDNYKPRDFTSRKGSKDYSISGDKANTKPREYAFRKGSENSSICQDVGNLKTCHCCMINNQEQCQKLLKSIDRENGDYASRKGSKEYTLNSDMGNTNSRDYASQRGFRDNSISKGMANTKPREDNSMREDMSITKPRDYTSREGSDDHSIKDDVAQPKRCRFSMTNNREQCYKLCTAGDLTSQRCSKTDPLWEYMADPPSSHGFVKNNQDHPLSDEITSPDDGDNKGCHCSSDDWENKGSQRGSEDIASPKSCQCNVKKNQRPSRESRKLIDNKIQDSRKGSDDISSPRSCQCNETINPDDGEDNPKTCNCTGENKGSLRESKDTYSPKGCQCNVKKNQEPSSKSRKSIDRENRASRKGSDDISSDGEHKDSQKESEYEPLTKDPVLTQKSPTPPSESRNTVRKKRTPDVPFYDPVPTAKGPTSPSESRNTVPKKRTPDVPFYEPTERPRSSEPTVRRKPRTYVENVYPSPRRTNVEMSKYSISKILSEMSLKPRSVSHTSLNSKQSNRISIVDNPSVPKPKKDSDKSMKLYRTSKRSVSDESIVNKKINIMTDSSSDSKNAEFRSPSEKSLQSSGSRRNSLSRYDSNKSLLSRRITEFMNSSNESVAGFKLKKVSDANIEDRNSGGRNNSEMGGNILEQFVKMFSEHTEKHTKSTKHLVDKSTYVRTIDKNKTKHPKHGSSKKCQGRSVESETLQNIITAMPPHSKNRLIELLKQENNDNFKKSIMESQGTSDIIKDTKLQWLIENKSQLFQLLSSLSPPSKGHHVHVSSLSQGKKQLGHDQFPTVIDGLKLTSGPEKGFDQNNLPKSDHAEATKNDKKDNRHHYSKENEWSKKEHNYISKVKDFKIRLLRQETDNSPPVLEEYNVAAFTRSLSSHPLQTGGADSKLNCKCKNLCGDRDMERLHAINEDNVETIWSDLKRFCQKNNAKYDDMLQKPVVLVPFRPDSEDNGQMMGMCKPDEWKELKFSRTNRNNQRPDSKSNSLTSKNLRANKCDHPKESMRRKYAKGSNIAPSSSQGKSNVCICCTSPKDKSKLFEYLRKNRISNRSKFPNSESPQTETRQTHRTNRNSPQYEISERNFRSNSEAKSTSQFSKPQSSQAKDRRYDDSTSEQSVNEFQVSPRENIFSNRSESPNSRSAQVDKGNPFIQFEKPDNFYCPNSKSEVSSRGYDVSCPCSAQAERKKPKKCIQSEQSNRSYLPKRSKSPTTRSPQVERRKSDKFNESKVPKSEPQVAPREQNRSESPKTERSYRPKAGPQVSRREQNRSESPKTERSYRPKAETEVSPREQNRSESPKTERSYLPKAETEVSPREQNRSESPKTERSYRPKAESPKENVAPIRSKIPKPRPFPAQPEDEAQLGVSVSSNDPSNQFESHSSFYPETEEQSNASERNNQQNAQFYVSQSSDDVRKSAADYDIVSHLGPRLFRCGSKDLRCPEEFSENAASHEAKEPSSILLFGREQMRDLRGKETISQQSESCVEYCNCSTNMTRDLHRQQQMQLLQKLQQANNEFDRRRQQQLEEYRGTQYGKKRREEAELICCYGYSQQQLQQRQQQRLQRQEQQQQIQQQQQNILQQQQIMQQQQIQQQQYIKQQQQIQQEEYIEKQQIQQQQQRQQQIQQQKIPQDEEYCCCCSCSDNFSQQQWTQQQQQQHAQLMDKRTVPNIQQHEMQQHQYIQQQQQIEQQKYIKQQTQKQQYSQQQQQHGNILDNHASPYFPQQQMQQQQQVRQQQLQQQEEKKYFTNYWLNSQQQKSQMIKFQQNNGQNEALRSNDLGTSPQQQQQQLPNFPCCYCNITPEPDLSDIRSSFYQQTLQKYGIQRLPEDFIPETVCCVPCSCCTCCPYAYGQQQQQRQH